METLVPFATVTCPSCPLAFMSGVGGVGVGVDACVTVAVCPAMDIVPVLAAELLAATLYATVPLPVPLLPDVIVSQE